MNNGNTFAYLGIMHVWNPSEDWLNRHINNNLRYEVTLLLPSEVMTHIVMKRLGEDHKCEQGVILSGGVFFSSEQPATITVGSGGQDGLESLAYGLNELLYPILREIDEAMSVEIVREVREVVYEGLNWTHSPFD